MLKRIIAVCIACVLCIGMFSTVVLAKTDAYARYMEAVQATVASGKWSEKLAMTADMSISYGKTKTETTVFLNSQMNISNYSENDMSKLYMLGSADISVMSQTYKWNVVYENGVAHYQYTEPEQSSMDVAMDPSCFDFNALTSDMLIKAKISRNRITFTISSEKMKTAEIAAVNMLSGIDDLHYGDVDVKVMLNEDNGTIDKITMRFPASLTFQGYDAEVDYAINYQFDADTNLQTSTNTDAKLKVYTSFPYASVGVDQTVGIVIVLYKNNCQTPIKEFSIGNNAPDVIELVDEQESDGNQVLKFKTLSEGTVILTITEKSTGATAVININVEERDSYYRCSNFPTPDASCFPIYVADFQCTENEDGTHNVYFNAYNTSYAYGVVVIYDSNGKFWGCKAINPRSDGTGMEYVAKGFWQSWEAIKYFFDEDMEFYELDGHAIQTEINFDNVPPNARIVVTADPKESDYVNLYTGIDIAIKSAFYTYNIDVNTQLYQKTVSKFFEEFFKAIPSNLVESTIHSFTESISKEMINGASSESVENIYEGAINMFQEIGLNADDLLKNILGGLGYSVADTVIISAVPAYSFVDITNKVLAISWPFVSSELNSERGKMEIHCIKHGSYNQLVNNSIIVTSRKEFQDTCLDAYQVIKEEELKSLPDSVGWNLINYVVYNIELREENNKVQPDNEIEIRLPVPEHWEHSKCVVYRIEENGKKTLMESTIESNYIIFKTDHLSYYVVGELVDYHVMLILGAITAVVLIIAAKCIVSIKRYRRTTHCNFF